MIKEPHAEETVTGIQVIQPSVSSRVKVNKGGPRQGRVADPLRALIQKIPHEIIKLKTVCEQTLKRDRVAKYSDPEMSVVLQGKKKKSSMGLKWAKKNTINHPN